MTREEQILTVATDLFFEKGYGHVGVDEIGQVVGLTGPALYRHFRGKGDILAALFDRAIDGILTATVRPMDDPFAELAFRVRAHARFVTDEHKLASVWIREGRSLTPEHRKRLRRRELSYVNQWVDNLHRCYPEKGSEELELASLTALGTLNSVSNWPLKPLTNTGLSESISVFVLAGLETTGRSDPL
ncbi:TetR/AcrR family transcriptional regulator [Mycolicibacterium hodleri]|uniref:TetR/AcrR family transcriptional regulator n=1 Tax=Mycolicibacterium hodleri TaxID=49897 RepID=UPI0013758BFB|nr:TetR/AcrR family transcriptional regulator [Mycolicibacterium hodleri]